MRPNRWLSVLTVAATAVLCLVVTSSAGAAQGGTVAYVPAYFSSAQMAAIPNGDWIDFGGNSFDQRYSALEQVNTANVANLKTAWHTHLYVPSGGRASGLVYRGVLYVAAGNDDVYAFDGATGDQLWHYVAGAGGGVTSGIAMGGGLIYLAQRTNTLVAIDAATGGTAWSHNVDSAKLGYYMSGAPEYYNGMVIEGIAGGENGIRGYISAFNALTGNEIWRFYTIPAPGEPGSDTWLPNSDWQHGGAPIWTHPLVDPSLGLVYAATGNAAPYNGRPAGDNLYTASIVALNANTGKLVWYYQTVHHDIWDDDIASSPVLFDAVINGQLRQGIDVPTKMGLNFILDRATGKPVFKVNEVAQPQDPAAPGLSPTQPIPEGTPFAEPCATQAEWKAAGGDDLAPDGKPFRFGCIYTPLIPTQYTVPGWHDVADWPPHAYNYKTGILYICSTNNRGDGYEAVPIAKANLVPGQNYTANVSKVAGDWTKGKVGVISALDVSNNGIRWQKYLPDGNGCYAGTATTAGGLLFVGEGSGHLIAMDAQSGSILWTSDQLDAAVGAPPITYTGSDGRQYVEVMAGGTNSTALPRGDSVYAFALPK